MVVEKTFWLEKLYFCKLFPATAGNQLVLLGKKRFCEKPFFPNKYRVDKKFVFQMNLVFLPTYADKANVH